MEMGKPFRKALGDMHYSASVFDYYAGLAQDQKGRVVAANEPDQLELVVKEPYGVVVCITPWNYPILLLSFKAAPALAAGNTVVVKPPSLAPLATLKMAEVFSILPKGVVNIITGSGSVVGEALVTHEKTAVISATGGVAMGQRIMELAAKGVKKLVLELGGNDAFIVCEDADLDRAARAGVWAAFLNTGQICTGSKRFFVVESIANQYIERFVRRTEALKVGNSLDEVDLGPLAGPKVLADFEGFIEDARSKGARILTGGKRPEHLKRGYFYLPTVLTELDNSMRILKEEAYGPAAPIVVVKDLNEAIERANETQYGLGAAVFTEGLENALKACAELEAGNIWINDPLEDNLAASHGGVKLSGFGRELGVDGLDEFRYSKRLHLDYSGRAKEWWF
jgi:betaine-aldehyde dehydrogenase